jgi:transcriptional regulator with XRE-family HTH domain
MAFTVQINPFGEWLKTKREQQGLSLQALAEKAGNVCSASYLARIETDYYFGEKNNPMKPEEATVEKLAAALNQSIDEARKAAGYLPFEASVEEEINGELQNALRKYKQLSLKSREFAARHFTEMIEFLLEFESTPTDSYETAEATAAAEENFDASNVQTEKPEILPEKEIKRRGIKPIKVGELKKKTP